MPQKPPAAFPNPDSGRIPAAPPGTERLGAPGTQGIQGIETLLGHQGGAQATKPSYTAVLSKECQKRKFNPHFNGWVTEDGRYKCSVRLNGDNTLKDSRSFASPTEAKQAIAKRAVVQVKKLPISGSAGSVGSTGPAARAAETNEKTRLATANAAWEEAAERAYQNAGYDDLVKGKPGVGGYAWNSTPSAPFGPFPYSSQYGFSHVAYPTYHHRITDFHGTNQAELIYLTERINALCEGQSPSPFVQGSEWTARAFLEGFALGEKLHRVSGHRSQAIQNATPYPILAGVVDRAYPVHPSPRQSGPIDRVDRAYPDRVARNRGQNGSRSRGRDHERERSPAESVRRGHRERSPGHRCERRQSNASGDA